MTLPAYDDLFNPLLKALRELGDSGSVAEISEKVASILELPEDELNKLHGGQGYETELDYRLAWARYYLKKYGLLDNSTRGVWALTEKGQETRDVDKTAVKRHVQSLQGKPKAPGSKSVTEGIESDEETEFWKESLIKRILSISPKSFEVLCQRVLRESGFVQVEVTGKSGDGGIDGHGVVKLGGLLSFHITFQCKRYSGVVTSQQIRDFRGATVGRADKGLFITTGSFTRDARAEANRDGASPIDLMDGSDLALKMKELCLGVRVEQREVVTLDEDWFASF